MNKNNLRSLFPFPRSPFTCFVPRSLFSVPFSPFPVHLFRSPFTILCSLFPVPRSPVSFPVHRSLFTCFRSLFPVLCSLLFLSCTPPTENNDLGSLSGTVILENDTNDSSLDPIDFSGITVSLYNLAVLDTTIVRINRQYPNIGVQISQETEFDHRLHNPVKTTVTELDGTFSLKKIPTGIYNLVALKEGWGFRCLYELTISEGESTLNPSNSRSSNQDSAYNRSKNNNTVLRSPVSFPVPHSPFIVLSPVRTMPKTINEPLTFQAGKIYHFPETTTIASDVVFENGTTILIESGKRLSIHGIVRSEGEEAYTKITSYSEIYSTSKNTTIERFGKITIRNQTTNYISNLVVSYSEDGVDLETVEMNLSDTIIRNSLTVSLMLNSNVNKMSNAIISDSEKCGIFSYNEVNLENSIISANKEGMFLSQTTSKIKNNYFIDNHVGLRAFYGTNEIVNNNFNRNDVSIAPSASSPSIFLNIFYVNRIDIEMNRGHVAHNPGYCNPEIMFNNFYDSQFYVHLKGNNSVYADGYIPFVGVNSDQHYPNNYLKSDDLTNRIYDKNYPGSTFSYTVDMTPRARSPYANAGISE